MEYLRDINMVSIIFRFLLTIVLGGTIGFERGKKGRPAGFRTHILVCMGATLVMLTNQYIIEYYQVGDPTRMGAQVISGIGFLGAGTIIVTGRHQVKGLTTAASLWVSACMGLALGIGFYEGAISVWIFILLVNGIMHNMGNHIRENSKNFDVYIEFESILDIKGFVNEMKEMDIYIEDMEIIRSSGKKEEGVSMIASLHSREKVDHVCIKHTVSKMVGVNYVENM